MKAFKYNGKIYCEEDISDKIDNYGGSFWDLLWELKKENSQIYSESTITVRYIGNDYYGTDEDKSDEETLDDIVDYGYEEVEKIEVEE